MSEWQNVTLKDVIKIRHGFAFKGEYFSETNPGPILVTPGNFAIGGGFKGDKKKYYTGAIPCGYTLSAGDLIVTMTDLSKAGDTLGYSAIVPGGATYLHNQRIGLVQIEDPSILDKHFLNYLLRTPSYRNYVLATSTGSTVRHTSPSRICEYSAKVPELRIQKAIADFLGALDDKIAVNDRIAAGAQALAEANYQKTAQHHSSKAATLKNILDLKYGKALPKSKRIQGSHPVYGSGGISGFHNAPLVDGPGIIIGRKGTVGSVYWSTGPFFPIDTTFYVQQIHSASLEYIFFALKNLGLEEMNSDSAVPGLNRSRVLDLSIQLPEVKVIEAFSTTCRMLFDRVDTARAEISSLVELRDKLLPKLVSGQVRIRDAERVVEDAV